ncbi:ATP-binding cassette sub-family C member 10-like [Argopecten irradians]|uniref:ATP-binding cassette sub-family C member 10-like n=1 Tax=Argopecten irradians TaxID=31199 RepID=UPI00370FC9BE
MDSPVMKSPLMEKSPNITHIKADEVAISHTFDCHYLCGIDEEQLYEYIGTFSIYVFIIAIVLPLIHQMLFKLYKTKRPTLYRHYGVHEDKVPNNEDNVSLFSVLTCNWVRPLLEKGRSRGSLSSKDMFPLPKCLNVKVVHERFCKLLHGIATQSRSRQGSKTSILMKALNRAYGKEFYLGCAALDLLDKLIGFTYTISLWKIMSFLENDDEPPNSGYLYVLTLCLSGFSIVLVDTIYEYVTMHIYIKVRISVMTCIYQKVLTLNTVSLSQFTTGEIVNFLGTDTDRLVFFYVYFHKIWIIPTQILICICILYRLVGTAFLGGLVVSFILVAFIKIISSKQIQLSKILMKQKDRRMGLMNGVLGGIKNIKLYSWEEHFRAAIDRLRNAELATMKQKKIFDAIMGCLSTLTPTAMTLLTFGIYSLLGNTLTASKMFTSLAVFLKLFDALNKLTRVINGLIEASISLERVDKLVAMGDVDLDEYFKPMKDFNDLRNVIYINDGTFNWNNDVLGTPESMKCENNNFEPKDKALYVGTLSLRNISINIKKGQFIGVVGKVGAGKSSLLHAVMAEMTREKGSISVSNLEHGFALACQEPWVQQATIRDNVLFGKPFNSKKYSQVLDAVALQEDIQMLPAGDNTEVGENGVTLSGGQKSRLALARAIYQDKDVYLLDDPLAAVDGHVAQHLYEKCIMGLLKNKTRILCTHHTKFLRASNLVVEMDDGVISKIGPPPDILEDTFFDENPISNKTRSMYDGDDGISDRSEGRLGKEKKATGEINSRVYRAFSSSLGKWLPVTTLLSIVCMETLQKIKDWYLTYWIAGLTITNNNTSDSGHLCFHNNISSPTSFNPMFDLNYVNDSGVSKHPNVMYYITVYGIIGSLYSLVSLAKEILIAYGSIRMARTMHDQLLSSVLKAPMSFFDVTPIGRILNRFSSDIGIIDDNLGHLINMVSCHVIGIIGTIVMASYMMPWFVVLLIPVAVVNNNIQKLYRHTSREVRRIFSLYRSPIFSQFSETLSGIVTIRAFRHTERFKTQHLQCMNKWLEARYTAHNIGNWLWIQTQVVVNVMVTGIAFLAVLEHNIHGIDPSVVGLTISYILSLTDHFDELACRLAETQKEMVSVERIQQYIDELPSEKWTGSKSSPSWPTSGMIRYHKVYMRYRNNLPNALKGLSFCTRRAEKVGIVGRTGSGKSSLFQTLFRTVEIHSGHISIDGVNIQELDLKDVRRHLAVIPQDPFLFSGTVRENLDPTSSYSDQQLWGVLDKCHLQKAVSRLGGLEGDVSEKGRHFSVGQRQLMCLARALLTRAKVLCIDEATASVDLETDMLIQATIRQEFNDSTVLTIAHRINTIMDSDRVLVMDQGRVVELDSPENLLKNSQSAFYKLVHGETYS